MSRVRISHSGALQVKCSAAPTAGLVLCTAHYVYFVHKRAQQGMPMLSSTKLRPLVGMFTGGRAASAGLAGAGHGSAVSPATFNLAVRSLSVLGSARSQKHLLSEFKGVKGPQSQEVGDDHDTQMIRRFTYAAAVALVTSCVCNGNNQTIDNTARWLHVPAT